MNSLQISDSGLLTADEISVLTKLEAELTRTFETAQVFRTHTEMLVSVLNDVKHPTPDSKYWQAVREQDVMFNELMMLLFEYRKTKIEIATQQRQLSIETNDLKQALLSNDIERLEYVSASMRRVAHNRMREIGLWSEIKAELEPMLKYGIDDVDAHQLEAMRQRFAAEATLVTSNTPPADARNILGLALTSRRIERGK
jgi:hypothetical protein